MRGISSLIVTELKSVWRGSGGAARCTGRRHSRARMPEPGAGRKPHRHCLLQTRGVCARERKRRGNPDFSTALDCFACARNDDESASARHRQERQRRAASAVIARSNSDEAIQSLFIPLDCFANARNDDEAASAVIARSDSDEAIQCHSAGSLRLRSHDGNDAIASRTCGC